MTTPSPLTPEEVAEIERSFYDLPLDIRLYIRRIRPMDLVATIRQLEGQVKEAMTVIEHGRELMNYAKVVVLKRDSEHGLHNLANALNRFDSADQHATLNRLEGGKAE